MEFSLVRTSGYSLVRCAISEEYAVSIFGVAGGRMFLRNFGISYLHGHTARNTASWKSVWPSGWTQGFVHSLREIRLRVFEKRMLRGTFVTKRKEVTEGWKKTAK